jgi:hypothetical protein
MNVSAVRSLVFGFLSVRDVVVSSYLVCRTWNGTPAAWPEVGSVRALRHAQTNSLEAALLCGELCDDADLRGVLGQSLRTLDIRLSGASLRFVLSVCKLPCLQTLWLPSLDPDRFLECASQISGFVSRLRTLGFHNALTEQSPSLLARFHGLVSLHAPDCSFNSPVQLAPLALLENLERLSLHGLRLTGHHCSGFPRVPRLQFLGLSSLRDLWAPCLQDVCSITSLRDLDMSYVTCKGNVDWSCLLRLQQLQRLTLNGASLTKPLCDAIRALESLESLSLTAVFGFWLHRIKGHPTLARLDLSDSYFTARELDFLNDMPALKWLSLECSRYTFDTSALEARGVQVKK